ncbi:MAG: RNA-binding protein [Hyphomicrobium sp.]|nr:RNA-binding protein [Hyphomicrobium sp.]
MKPGTRATSPPLRPDPHETPGERGDVARKQAHTKHGEESPETGSERTCALTREHREPEELIRFVAAPDGTVVPDLDRRLPGRGVWLTGNREIVEKAVKTKAFSRGLRATAVAPADLAIRIETLLVRRAGDTLALANKAGLVSTGFQQVDSALDKGSVAALIHGADAAADGCHKLDRKFRAIQKDRGQDAPIVTALTVNEIGLAMGRPSVVHAALISGGLTERFLREAGRLVRYRTSSAVPELPVPTAEPRTEG